MSIPTSSDMNEIAQRGANLLVMCSNVINAYADHRMDDVYIDQTINHIFRLLSEAQNKAILGAVSNETGDGFSMLISSLPDGRLIIELVPISGMYGELHHE